MIWILIIKTGLGLPNGAGAHEGAVYFEGMPWIL